MLGTPFAGESGLELEIEAGQIDKLLDHLNHFIIMDDVELVPLGEEQVGEAGSETAIGLTGPQADEVLERVGLPAIGEPHVGNQRGMERVGPEDFARLRCAGASLRVLAALGGTGQTVGMPAHGGATPVGSAALESFRIAEGIPAYGIDMTERDLPQETSQMRALHFAKGCYLGQEIVERIRSRGNVHRHLRPLELAGPVPSGGTELTLEDGKAAGQITSAAELPFDNGGSAFLVWA